MCITRMADIRLSSLMRSWGCACRWSAVLSSRSPGVFLCSSAPGRVKRCPGWRSGASQGLCGGYRGRSGNGGVGCSGSPVCDGGGAVVVALSPGGHDSWPARLRGSGDQPSCGGAPVSGAGAGTGIDDTGSCWESRCCRQRYGLLRSAWEIITLPGCAGFCTQRGNRRRPGSVSAVLGIARFDRPGPAGICSWG